MPACPIFLYLFFKISYFWTSFYVSHNITILNRFFEITSQSGEMHLKSLSSSSKLGTTVATLLFVGRSFALKQKNNVLSEKCKQNELFEKHIYNNDND